MRINNGEQTKRHLQPKSYKNKIFFSLWCIIIPSSITGRSNKQKSLLMTKESENTNFSNTRVYQCEDLTPSNIIDKFLLDIKNIFSINTSDS